MEKKQLEHLNDQAYPDLGEGGKRFQEAYAASLALWPVPYEAFYVPTTFGMTHIIASGPADAPPLVLLHGALFSSTMWFPNAEAWSRRYRIIAVDILGDKNRSIPGPGCSSRAEYAAWLLEVFDQLGIGRARLVGLSLGGMHAVNLLVRAPERIERAVVISPAESFVHFHQDFYTYAFGLLQPNGVKAFLDWMFAGRYLLPETFSEQFHEAVAWKDEARSGIPKENGFPYVFTDEELASICVPLLVMMGDEEVIYNPREALERAKKLVPGIETHLVRGAGHVLSMEKANFVNETVEAFFR
ncbi:alpha/beta fold hydrolase [Brevibacillus borstelensis]|uniref:alpha/beta fold hydrolase n=1 Tax=Brevibacillus borstelensis TaxID=45462 RepID=UPI0030C5B20F